MPSFDDIINGTATVAPPPTAAPAPTAPAVPEATGFDVLIGGNKKPANFDDLIGSPADDLQKDIDDPEVNEVEMAAKYESDPAIVSRAEKIYEARKARGFKDPTGKPYPHYKGPSMTLPDVAKGAWTWAKGLGQAVPRLVMQAGQAALGDPDAATTTAENVIGVQMAGQAGKHILKSMGGRAEPSLDSANLMFRQNPDKWEEAVRKMPAYIEARSTEMMKPPPVAGMPSPTFGETTPGQSLTESLGKAMEKIKLAQPLNDDERRKLNEFAKWMEPKEDVERAKTSNEFKELVDTTRSDMLLASGQPLAEGVVAEQIRNVSRLTGEEKGAEELYSPETLKAMGVDPVDIENAQGVAAAADPVNAALMKLPGLPGMRRVGGALAAGLGGAGEVAAKVGRKVGPLAVGAAGAKVYSDLAKNDPMGALETVGATALGYGLLKLGGAAKIVRQGGWEALTGGSYAAPATAALAKAARDTAGKGAGTKFAKQFVPGAKVTGSNLAIDMLAAPIATAPINAALAHGDPQSFWALSAGAPIFGALGVVGGIHPQLAKAVLPAMRAGGKARFEAMAKKGDKWSQRSAALVDSLPEKARNAVYEMTDGLGGMTTEGAAGTKGVSEIVPLTGADYVAFKAENNLPGGDSDRGFALHNGKAYINTDYAGVLGNKGALAHVMGHEFGGHVALQILRSFSSKGGPLYDGLYGKIREALVDRNGNPSPQFKKFADHYNAEMAKGGKPPLSQEAMIEEFMSETAGRIFETKGMGHIVIPEGLRDKLQNAISGYFGKMVGIDPREVGGRSYFSHEESGAVTGATMDLLRHIASPAARDALNVDPKTMRRRAARRAAQPPPQQPPPGPTPTPTGAPPAPAVPPVVPPHAPVPPLPTPVVPVSGAPMPGQPGPIGGRRILGAETPEMAVQPRPGALSSEKAPNASESSPSEPVIAPSEAPPAPKTGEEPLITPGPPEPAPERRAAPTGILPPRTADDDAADSLIKGAPDGNQAALDLAHQAAGTDKTLFQRREDPLTGRVAYSGRLDFNKAEHRALARQLGLGEGDIAKIQAADSGGDVRYVDYWSAEKAVDPDDITGKERKRDYELDKGKKSRQLMQENKGIVFTGVEVTKNGKVLQRGISLDKLVANISKLLGAAQTHGVKVDYTGINDPAIRTNIKAYVENHKNGYKGDGSGPVVGAVQTPGYTPQRIPRNQFDVINAALHYDISQKPSEHARKLAADEARREGGAKVRKRPALQPQTELKAEEAQRVAKENQWAVDDQTGDVNPFRAMLNKGGKFTYTNKAGETRTGTGDILESVWENLSPDMIEAVREQPSAEPSIVRKVGLESPAGEFSPLGVDWRNVAAGFMPGGGEPTGKGALRGGVPEEVKPKGAFGAPRQPEDIAVERWQKGLGKDWQGPSVFFGPDGSGYSDYGPDRVPAAIAKDAKLYQGEASESFLRERELLDKPSPIVKELTGRDTIDDLHRLGDAKRIVPNGEFAAMQAVAKDVLAKEGYDGARWTYEDELSPEQFQIWNKDVIRFMPGGGEGAPVKKGALAAEEPPKGGFYSQLERVAAAKIKGPMSAEQIANTFGRWNVVETTKVGDKNVTKVLGDFGYLDDAGAAALAAQGPDRKVQFVSTSGVKSAEMDAVLGDFLRAKAGQKIKPDELKSVIEKNKVELQEHVFGDDPAAVAALQKRQNEIDTQVADLNHKIVESMNGEISVRDLVMGYKDYEDLNPEAQKLWDERIDLMNERDQINDDFVASRKPAKFGTLTLPGGKEYRETAYTLKREPQTDVPEGFTIENDGIRWRVNGPGPLAENRYASGHTKESAIANFWKTHGGSFGRPSHQAPSAHSYGTEADVNRLFHTRSNVRKTTGGEEILFGEEFQSDLHQQGRKKGYLTTKDDAAFKALQDERDLYMKLSQDASSVTPEEMKKYNISPDITYPEIDRKIHSLHETMNETTERLSDALPDLPLKGHTWKNVAIKKLLDRAVKEGKTAIGWTTGEQQNQRYSLSRHFNRIEAHRVDNTPSLPQEQGTFLIQGYDKEGRAHPYTIKGHELHTVVGDSLAAKILQHQPPTEAAIEAQRTRYEEAQNALTSGPAHGPEADANLDAYHRERKNLNAIRQGATSFEGLDLEIGGEGMKGFYDKELVNLANDIGKKYGAKVTKDTIRTGPEYSLKKKGATYDIVDDEGRVVSSQYDSPEDAAKDLAHYNKDNTAEAWKLTITPELKAAVEKGQAMFMPGGGEGEVATKRGALAAEEPPKAAKPFEDKNLGAVHNLDEGKLRHALKMGGLAMPSMAGVRIDKSKFGGFGDITLVGGKDLIDPQRNRGAKWFNADVYSPRYPTTRIEFQGANYDRAREVFKPYADEIKDIAQQNTYGWHTSDVIDKIQDRGFRETGYSQLAQYGYLRDKGLIEPRQIHEAPEQYLSKVESVARKHREQVAQWVEDKINASGVPYRDRIKAGYTASGKQRTIEHTLENVVKMMHKEGIQGGEGFNYGVPSIRAKKARKFGALEKMGKEREKIVSKEQMEVLKDETTREFNDLQDKIEKLRIEKPHGFDTINDDVMALAEGGPENWKYLRGVYGDNYQEMTRTLQPFFDKLADMPTEYFEGKMKGAVQINGDNFAGAVVPEGTSQDVIDRLERRGIAVAKYPAGDAEARRAAVETITRATGANFMPGGGEGKRVEKPADLDKGFYSHLERVAKDKIRGPMTGEQIANTFGRWNVVETYKEGDKTKTRTVGEFPYLDEVKANTLAAEGENRRAQFVSSSGVKAEELDWVLGSYLRENRANKIKPADLQAEIDANKVRLETRTLKGADLDVQDPDTIRVSEEDFTWEEHKANEETAKRYDIEPGETVIFGHHPGEDTRYIITRNTDPYTEGEFAIHGDWGDAFGADSIEDAKARSAAFAEQTMRLNAEEDIRYAERTDETHFRSSSFPGGENYEETLFKLPEKKAYYETLDELIASETRNVSPERKEEAIKVLTDRWNRSGGKMEKDTGQEQFTESHWPDPGVVFHMRTSDRYLDSGDRSLLIDESQSDLHQKARKRGYQTPEDKKARDAANAEYFRLHEKFSEIDRRGEEARERMVTAQREAFKRAGMDQASDLIRGTPEERAEKKARLHEAQQALPEWLKAKADMEAAKDEAAPILDAMTTARTAADKSKSKIPDAPLKGNAWKRNSLKQGLAKAVADGKDSLAWTPGKYHAARYDMSHLVERIEYHPSDRGDYSTGDLYAYDHEGNQVVRKRNVPLDELSEHIGDEPTKKLMGEIENKKWEREQWSVEESDEQEGWFNIYDPNGDMVHDRGGDVEVFKTKEDANKFIDDWAFGEYDQPAKIEGLDVRIGEAGFVGVYDVEFKNMANELGKKYGAKVEVDYIRGLRRDPATNKVELGQPRNQEERVDVFKLPITEGLRKAVEAGQAMFMPGSGEKPIPKRERNKNFNAWRGKAKLYEYTDDHHEIRAKQPIVFEGFHGTTHDFTVIDPARGNPENDLGRGYYVTNTPEDVQANYAGEGPDLTSRIENRVDRIDSDIYHMDAEEVAETFKISEDDANELLDHSDSDRSREIKLNIARKELKGHGGATQKVFVKMEKPLVIGKNEEYWPVDFDEETGDPTGRGVEFMDALRRVANRFDDADVDADTAHKLQDLSMEGGTVSEFIKAAKEAIPYATDDEGNLANAEVIRQAIEAMGYDGIVDKTVDAKFGTKAGRFKPMAGMTPDTVHVIAFKPEQIKSATGNIGTFDPKNPDMTLMPGGGEGPKRASYAGDKMQKPRPALRGLNLPEDARRRKKGALSR